MNSLNFLDANVCVALIWEGHVHSASARHWFEHADDQQFLYCRFVQLAVLRLITNERVLRGDALTMADAWRAWDRFILDSRIAYVEEPRGLELHFRQRSRLNTRSPKVWADAYLLAFAEAAGLKLVTFDRALASRGPDVMIL